MDKIDFVVTWVDGNDPIWLQEKSLYTDEKVNYQLNDDNRYREMEAFKYWFRAVETYAPWVNKIFFVTYGHLPVWLDTNNPKLEIVKHEDYIPKDYLPTYNSTVIELNLHRIKNLSEKFVLFSDDVFLNSTVTPTDFFKNNLPRLLGVYRPIIPQKDFNVTELNNVRLINHYFYDKKCIKKNISKFFTPKYGKFNLYNFFSLFYSGIMGYEDTHVGLPHLKSSFKEIWELEPELLNRTCLHRFREIGDINHWVMSYYNIERNNFYPQSLKIGKYVPIADDKQIKQALRNSKYKMICINDDESSVDFSGESRIIEEELSKKFPRRSKFERSWYAEKNINCSCSIL
ncbi:Stealth CR1 domain-containing protein [Streptococcus hyointestinalis]|uniref:stealth family protein n=1 Tax=Streptococcus hyointestinalis TaxID=1337 RepID=UPI0035172649